MQDLLKRNLPHFVLLFIIAVTILVWFTAFPTKVTYDGNDILFESVYLIVSFVCYYLIVKLDLKLCSWAERYYVMPCLLIYWVSLQRNRNYGVQRLRARFNL